MDKAELDIVVPLYNEVESLNELHKRLVQSMDAFGCSFRLWLIDDGSNDGSWSEIERIAALDQRVIGLQLSRNYGKTVALKEAFARVSAPIVVTLDADLQDRPEEIANLVNKLRSEDLHMVSGWKQERKDPRFTKNLPSLLFNWAARKTSGLELHDFNCGLKAYRIEVVKSLELYADMHRYIPVMAKNNGFDKIGEAQIQHEARKYGVSKFGNDRFVRGFLDLITLWFLSRFTNRPMHFFGTYGTLMFLFGFLSAFYLGVNKLYHLYIGEPARLVTDNPFFYIALTCMLLGAQLFLTGFVAELFIRRNQTENISRVLNKINV